ncbi:hypothetical protein Bca4012_064295 [Brassica carinata]
MQVRMDAQQVCLESFEDLLDSMAVRNPLLQRALDERRQTLWMRQHPSESIDRDSPGTSAPNNYFDGVIP